MKNFTEQQRCDCGWLRNGIFGTAGSARYTCADSAGDLAMHCRKTRGCYLKNFTEQQRFYSGWLCTSMISAEAETALYNPAVTLQATRNSLPGAVSGKKMSATPDSKMKSSFLPAMKSSFVTETAIKNSLMAEMQNGFIATMKKGFAGETKNSFLPVMKSNFVTETAIKTRLMAETKSGFIATMKNSFVTKTAIKTSLMAGGVAAISRGLKFAHAGLPAGRAAVYGLVRHGIRRRAGGKPGGTSDEIQ